MSKTFITEFSCTTSCNLNCSYCYSKHIPGRSTPEIADKFLESIPKMMELYNKENYHVSFFGGEPLLNWDIITYLIPKLKQDPKCKSYTVITNGLLLTEEKYNYLRENRCGISLSFDGIWNNDSRPLAAGGNSFNKYIENKDLLSRVGGCKVMLSPNNFSTMTENFKFFVDEYGFSFPDFSLIRDDIYTKEDIEIFSKEVKRLADTVIEYNKNGKFCGTGLFNLYLLDTLIGAKFKKRNYGCFAGVGGALYSTDGKYYPCERFGAQKSFILYDAVEDIWYKDNIEFLLQDKCTNNEAFEKCLSCELYRYCNAGCTHSQLKNGKWEKAEPVDSVCQLLKLSYREAYRVYKELKDLGYNRYLNNRLN